MFNIVCNIVVFYMYYIFHYIAWLYLYIVCLISVMCNIYALDDFINVWRQVPLIKRLWQIACILYWVTFILHSCIERPDVSFKRWSLDGLFSVCFFVNDFFVDKHIFLVLLLRNKNPLVRNTKNSPDVCSLGLTINEPDSHQSPTPVPRWMGEDDK